MTAEVKTHVYQPDPSLRKDWSGSIPCQCGLPRKNQHHDVQPTDPEVEAVERRRLGERLKEGL